MKRLTILLASIGLLLSSSAASAYTVDENTSIHTYISQGMLYTPDNPINGMKDVSFDVRGIGININHQYSDNLRFSGHVLARQKGEAAKGEPELPFLLADYTVSSSENSEFGIRVGRIKNQFGIYNASREVPNSRPGFYVPQSVYFESSFRDLMVSTDGINLYFNAINDLGVLNLNLYAGQKEVSKQAFENFVFQKEVTGDFEKTDTLGFKVDFTPNSLPNLSIGYSILNLKSHLEGMPSYDDTELAAAKLLLAADPKLSRIYITSFETDILLQLLSLQYDFGNWLFTTEYAKVDTEQSNITVLYDTRKGHKYESEGYYFQLEYLGWDNFTAFVRYDYQELGKGSKEELQYNPSGRFPAEIYSYGESFAVGGRWYIQPELTLSAQYARTEGISWLPRTEGYTPNDYQKTWDVLAFRLTYEF